MFCLQSNYIGVPAVASLLLLTSPFLPTFNHFSTGFGIPAVPDASLASAGLVVDVF
jgi:hypothetical protein